MSEPALQLKRDAKGRCRARWKTPPEAASGLWLPQWLESDLQDEGTCRRVSDRIRSIRDSGHGEWKFSGNAFGLTVGPRRVLITPLHAPPAEKPLRVATRMIDDLLVRWASLLAEA